MFRVLLHEGMADLVISRFKKKLAPSAAASTPNFRERTMEAIEKRDVAEALQLALTARDFDLLSETCTKVCITLCNAMEKDKLILEPNPKY